MDGCAIRLLDKPTQVCLTSLRAMALFTSGSRGDLDEVTDALALLRHVGLEGTARQAAIEYLVLDRRG